MSNGCQGDGQQAGGPEAAGRSAVVPGSPFAPGSPFVEYLSPPRLGIIHLLAWTAATAVLLKVSMAMEMLRGTDAGSMSGWLEASRQGIDFVFTTARAAGFVGAWLLLKAKARRLPGRLQPGHWLLLVGTAGYLLCSVPNWFIYIRAMATGSYGEASYRWILAVYGVEEIVSAGAYFYVSWACRHGRRWRVYFGILAAVYLMAGFSRLLVALLFWPWLGLGGIGFLFWLVGLVLLATVVLDVRRGPRRDWLHWLGIAILGTALVTLAASWVLVTLAIRFMP